MDGQTGTRTIRLLLLDDHVLFREGLSRLLASEPDFELAGQCGASAEAIDILKRTAVDVVLLDFDLGNEHSSAFINSAREAGYSGRILMVTAGMSASESATALQLGASGVFLKHDSPGTLAAAIRLVASGGIWMDERVARQMADTLHEARDQSTRRALTSREQEVLRGVFEGLTNKEIASQLGVSEGAVKGTLQQLFQKTGVRTRSQLVRIAIEESLGSPRSL